jgi:hypothetical protein
MSEIYAIDGDNLTLIEAIEKTYDNPDEYVRLSALQMGTIAVQHVVNESGKVESHHKFTGTMAGDKVLIKYVPVTRPNLVRQIIDEKTDQVIEIEAEQRSMGFCFVGSSTEQHSATLVIPRNMAKAALLEVFERDEI